MSAAFEVLAWNDLTTALMEDFAELDPHDRNLARRAFLESACGDTTLYGVSDAVEFRHHVVATLRSTAARYPSDPAVTGLVDELRKASLEFARMWQRHDAQAEPVLTNPYRHPVVGDLTVDCDTLTLTDRDQHHRAGRITRRRGPGVSERRRRCGPQRGRNDLSAVDGHRIAPFLEAPQQLRSGHEHG